MVEKTDAELKTIAEVAAQRLESHGIKEFSVSSIKRNSKTGEWEVTFVAQHKTFFTASVEDIPGEGYTLGNSFTISPHFLLKTDNT
ncbi:hypothetical protein NIES4103_31390 [Nostoc sp. NIES-4103]|nr:hypothetical protein NIES4103_31390 [Nostoc sp. NIES-4103]